MKFTPHLPLGKQGLLIYNPESLAYRVKILDVKTSYGQDRILVTPVAGTGERWVSAERVQVGE